MSAASPRMCWEFLAPPMALFTAYDLKPELTWIGSPWSSLRGCSSLPHNWISAVVSCRFGVFVIPVLVLVSSERVKFFVICIVCFVVLF